ncbi:Fic/DOC family protein [Lactobacillus sp. PSON]|uniref:Fic/DOC family protein n=1 Tax=Lactobacillus sp. PSON TaxID=3455454 RepID=UPI004040F910
MSNWIEETIYPNGVLINKLNIHDAKKLAALEYEETAVAAIKILQRKPKVNNIMQLTKLHKLMFYKLYDWAGKYRWGNFQKDGYTFFDYKRFRFAEIDINNLLQEQSNKRTLSALDYAQLLDLINYMHPFREGNGRSARLFLQCYAANHQQIIDYQRNNDQMILAQQNADTEAMAKLIKVENTMTREIAFQQLIMKRNAQHKNKHL